jgi:hypothetical protein
MRAAGTTPTPPEATHHPHNQPPTHQNSLQAALSEETCRIEANAFRHDASTHRRRMQAGGLCLVLISLSAACNGGDPPSPETSLPQDGCTIDYPLRLSVYSDDPDEMAYLDQIAACSDDPEQSTLLVNNSAAAWTISTTYGAPVTQLDHDLKVTLFRSEIAEIYQGAVLAPGESVIVRAPPIEVEWHIQPGFSAVWLLHDALYETLSNYGQEQIEDLVVNKSLRRQAFLTCGKGLYDILKKDLSGLNSDGPNQSLLSAVGIGENISECSQAWVAADEAAAQKFRTTATWTDDVAGLADNAAFRSTADDMLSFWKRVGLKVFRTRA